MLVRYFSFELLVRYSRCKMRPITVHIFVVRCVLPFVLESIIRFSDSVYVLLGRASIGKMFVVIHAKG